MNGALLYDRIAGCLIGGALGDALGYEVEFLPWEMIRREYGGPIRSPVPHNGIALFSDDTQMTLFTNEGLVIGYWQEKKYRSGKRPDDYIFQAYLCWLKTQGEDAHSDLEQKSELMKVPGLYDRRAPGNTCLFSLRGGVKGTVAEPLNDSKGCGGVMRSAPAGFMPFWERPLILGARSAASTHGNPGAWVPAGMLSDIVCRCLYEDHRTLHGIIDDSLDAVRKQWKMPEAEHFSGMVKNAVWLSGSAVPEVDAVHSIGGGWVGDEALAIAVYSCLRHPDSITDALITAVNHSGDSDSTGSIAGNILGAYHGLSRLPGDWIARLELRDVILRQAKNMTEAVMDHMASLRQ